MKILDLLLLRFLQLLMLLIVLSVCWQVTSRYLLGVPSSFTEELARFLLIWLTMLGTVYAYRENAHLGLDIVYEKSSDTVKRNMYRLFHTLIGLFAIVVMVCGGVSLVLMTYTLGQTSAVMGLDIGLVYIVLPLSGAWVFVYSLVAIGNTQQFHDQEQDQ